MFRVKVFVNRRPSILDPQGKAVEQGAVLLGLNNIKDVRINKFIEFSLDSNNMEDARKEADEFCHKLLANPNIEDYSFELIRVDEN